MQEFPCTTLKRIEGEIFHQIIKSIVTIGKTKIIDTHINWRNNAIWFSFVYTSKANSQISILNMRLSFAECSKGNTSLFQRLSRIYIFKLSLLRIRVINYLYSLQKKLNIQKYFLYAFIK